MQKAIKLAGVPFFIRVWSIDIIFLLRSRSDSAFSPLLAAVSGPFAVAASALAALAFAAGMLIERWLFFAEARDAVVMAADLRRMVRSGAERVWPVRFDGGIDRGGKERTLRRTRTTGFGSHGGAARSATIDRPTCYRRT